MDWIITLTLGMTLTLALPLSIKLIRNRKQTDVKTKNGNVLVAQISNGCENSVAVAVKGDDNKVYTNTGTGNIFVASSPVKYGETEQRKARKDIKFAFESFFYTFLGNQKPCRISRLHVIDNQRIAEKRLFL